ncbi:MAG TPA: peptidoglycan-binding protein [Actinomyces sp.]|jgi:peptidoglycan hydrolase-like protein with peptidoglycan-binding domain|nr:peptidoglycan-binding domain-containing protein [Acidobacteriota bacterium]HHT41762.1 peptidoglycan-binding protein [Actinomyces sp.]
MHAKLRSIVAVLAVLAVGIATGWAIRELTLPKTDSFQGSDYALVEAQEGELSRDIRLDASVNWSHSRPIFAATSGVLTEISTNSNAPTSSGDKVLSIDMRPAFAIPGGVPIYRDLANGDKGADVSQLQAFLANAQDTDLEVSGTFDESTRLALRAWQEKHGLEQSDVAVASSFISIPELPAQITWLDETQVGSHVNEGQRLGDAYYGEPTFTIESPSAQASIIIPGMKVTLQSGDENWEAQVAEIGSPKDDGSSTITLTPLADDNSICGNKCSTIMGSTIRIPSLVHVVEQTTGIVVPTASITNGNDGSAVVISEDGAELPVTVVATVGGQSVVQGINAGQSVRVGASLGPTPEGSQ